MFAIMLKKMQLIWDVKDKTMCFLIVFNYSLYTDVKMSTFWSVWFWFIIYNSRQPHLWVESVGTSDFDTTDLELMIST